MASLNCQLCLQMPCIQTCQYCWKLNESVVSRVQQHPQIWVRKSHSCFNCISQIDPEQIPKKTTTLIARHSSPMSIVHSWQQLMWPKHPAISCYWFCYDYAQDQYWPNINNVAVWLYNPKWFQSSVDKVMRTKHSLLRCYCFVYVFAQNQFYPNVDKVHNKEPLQHHVWTGTYSFSCRCYSQVIVHVWSPKC